MSQGEWQEVPQGVKMNIMEDSEIGQGRYAHVFLTSYDHVSNHFRLDFYQDSTPTLENTQVNRRLVSRIFLTTEGMLQLGHILTDLNQKIEQKKRIQLPAGDSSVNPPKS